MNTLLFKLAKYEDIEEIVAITKRAISFMQDDLKIEQWSENYPTKEHFKKDIDQKELYILKDKNTTIGFICINKQVYTAYDQVKWDENTNFKVLHRVCVDPLKHGYGYGQLLYTLAEKEIKKQGINFVRVDTFSLNIPMNNLIKKLNYSFKGQMDYVQNKPKWNCYEKKL